ncbi:MAG: hypothetical protein A2X56_12590 [Nitrospirae bacterium GWC2_57_13]|nr:MAG: hypothetical protein A2X56_12590 [Nitrospirae bacterium GWC2_57_13]HAS55613.1 hypothetical protein [Nitrospiraceae bacterium]
MRYFRFTLLSMVLFIAAIAGASSWSNSAHAATPHWKAEFEAICAHTGNATELSKDEIKVLIDRCRKLEPALEKLEATEKKVYKRRLQMCRELYEYVLKSKEAAETSPAKQ